jgi:hypothetical protein
MCVHAKSTDCDYVKDAKMSKFHIVAMFVTVKLK